MFQECLQMRKKIYEEDKIHKEIAETYNNLSTIYLEIGDLENTFKMAHKSL